MGHVQRLRGHLTGEIREQLRTVCGMLGTVQRRVTSEATEQHVSNESDHVLMDEQWRLFMNNRGDFDG